MLIERLSQESGLRIDRLKFFAETASRRYYVFSVPKAAGGYRQIAHPARPLKAVQRWLNSRYLGKLPVDGHAMAYRKGINIRKNAEQHAGTRFTLRVDFRDFFPSFTIFHVIRFLSNNRDVLDVTEQDIQFLAKIVCRFEGLTIGAPSSPVLTNAMMYEFDQSLSSYCATNRLIYTRYADDLFLSTSETNVLREALGAIGKMAAEFPYANLEINRSKTSFLSKKYHREVTGLVLTTDGGISIGRHRKREIKALLHGYLIDQLAQDRVEYLKGLLSFASDVEPAFVASLMKKYGEDAMFMLYQQSKKVETSFSLLEAIEPPPESP